MSNWQILVELWDWEPSVVIGCVALLAAYAVLTRLRPAWKAGLFTIGVLVILLALVSPLDALADQYLFSAHMLQHVLVMLIAPIFLVAGLPPELLARALRRPWLARMERVLRHPLVGWAAGVGILWFWHAPPLYDLALKTEGLHVFQHLTYIACGVLFWWPVLCPLESHRARPYVAVFYLFGACLADSILGILITFARPGLYGAYVNPADPLGILPRLRAGWGMTVDVDQKLGGLIMWVPCCFMYVSVVMVVLARWFRAEAAAVLGMPPEEPAAREDGAVASQGRS